MCQPTFMKNILVLSTQFKPSNQIYFHIYFLYYTLIVKTFICVNNWPFDSNGAEISLCDK